MCLAIGRRLGCVPKESEEEEAHRADIVKKCAFDTAQAAVPNFLAASVAVFIVTILNFIADSGKHRRHSHHSSRTVELGLVLMVAVLFYVLGKYITWSIVRAELEKHHEKDHQGHEHVHGHEHGKGEKQHSVHESSAPTSSSSSSSSSSVSAWLVRNKVSFAVKHFFAELSGFLFKDFLIQLILDLIYGDYGFGPAFAMWLAFIFFYLAVIRGSARLMDQKYHLSMHEQEEQIEFDVDAFALSLAYVITALLSLGSASIGFTYINPESYLYSYEADYDPDEPLGRSQYCYLYVWVCSGVVGLILVLESHLGITFHAIEEESHHGHEEEKKGDEQAEKTTDEQEKDLVHDSSIHLRHSFYGCFCGLAWFLLIVDNIAHILGSGAQNNFIGVTVVAVLLSRVGPYVLASRIIQLEKRQKRVEEKRKAADPEEASASPTCLNKIHLWFLTHGLQRCSVSFVAFRLALGWVWEVVVDLLFDMISGTSSSRALKVISSLAAMILAIIIGAVIVWSIRDWEVEQVDKPLDEIVQVPELTLSTLDRKSGQSADLEQTNNPMNHSLASEL
eukprot:gene3544-3881_t